MSAKWRSAQDTLTAVPYALRQLVLKYKNTFPKTLLCGVQVGVHEQD